MQELINDIKRGNFIIIQDDKNREDEADLMIAGEYATQEKITFMLQNCSGIICVPMNMERINKIGIPTIKKRNPEDKTAPFTIAVDARECHTGVSAYDRYLTIKRLCNDNARIDDFILPGHVFPLYAHKEGLKGRKGHTEAAVELMKRAGLKEVAVICELMNTSANCMDKKAGCADKNTDWKEKNKIGEMMKGKDVDEFCRKYNIKKISIKNIQRKSQKSTTLGSASLHPEFARLSARVDFWDTKNRKHQW